MTSRNRAAALSCVIGAAVLLSCGNVDGPRESSQVVVYTSVDRVFSEPVLQEAARRLGLKVIGVFDTEETKSTGLVNRLLARRDNPDGDIFWSGDPGRAALLKEKGVTAQYRSPAATGIPAAYTDPEHHWIGFSARARVLLINNESVPPDEGPKGLIDLTDPKWKGRVAMANPLFGTTSYHVAALFEAWGEEKAWQWLRDLKANGVQIAASNGEVKRHVASGQATVGLTDTDDASEAIKDGQPVRAVFLDQEREGGAPLGTLVMPNTLSLIRNGPNPEGAKKVFDFLLSPDVQAMLANSCAQTPLSPGVEAQSGVLSVASVVPMNVNYARVAERLDAILPELKRWVEDP